MAFEKERFLQVCHASEEVLLAFPGKVTENGNVLAAVFAELALAEAHGQTGSDEQLVCAVAGGVYILRPSLTAL